MITSTKIIFWEVNGSNWSKLISEIHKAYVNLKHKYYLNIPIPIKLDKPSSKRYTPAQKNYFVYSQSQQLLDSHYEPRFLNNSGRWALVSLVLLLISCFFFFCLGLGAMPWTCAMALLFAVFVAGFIPFFWRSFSMSIISRGSSIPLNNCFRSSSTLIGTLGSFGYAMSSCESKFDSSQISPAAFKD